MLIHKDFHLIRLPYVYTRSAAPWRLTSINIFGPGPSRARPAAAGVLAVLVYPGRAHLLLVIANFACISSFWVDLGIDYGSKRAPEIDGTVLGMQEQN